MVVVVTGKEKDLLPMTYLRLDKGLADDLSSPARAWRPY
jgi:hypothetical protein